jgi:transposase InsO family protein
MQTEREQGFDAAEWRQLALPELLRSITPSMSRKGNCWDNACSETLFSSLKVERL